MGELRELAIDYSKLRKLFLRRLLERLRGIQQLRLFVQDAPMLGDFLRLARVILLPHLRFCERLQRLRENVLLAVELVLELLGFRFALRRFHDAVLLDGPVPLDLLEQNIAAWIDAEMRAVAAQR